MIQKWNKVKKERKKFNGLIKSKVKKINKCKNITNMKK